MMQTDGVVIHLLILCVCRGRRILKAVLERLTYKEGMMKATDVILSGCSCECYKFLDYSIETDTVKMYTIKYYNCYTFAMYIIMNELFTLVLVLATNVHVILQLEV